MTHGALIYARVSTLNQAEEGTSLDTQAQAGIALAESLNVPVLKVYCEVFTGTELYDRPRLSEAREEIRAGRCSHLICYAIDRLSRNPIHVAIIVMDCDRMGVQLHFVSEPGIIGDKVTLYIDLSAIIDGEMPTSFSEYIPNADVREFPIRIPQRRAA